MPDTEHVESGHRVKAVAYRLASGFAPVDRPEMKSRASVVPSRAWSLVVAWAIGAAGVAPANGRAEAVADRKGAVLNDRAKLERDLRWIYNDVDRGFAEARRTGKPLLVVLRCIPCLACSGIDAKVLMDQTELSPILDQFVCVRVINANALDLTRFQFDFDLSFSTLIFNGDGTLYGRYGSWVHQKNPKEQAVDGYLQSLEGALAIHRGYPGNQARLAGKQARPTPYKTPIEMPSLQGKYGRNLDWEGKVVQSCVHCHQIGDAARGAHRSRGESIPPDLVFPFPAPETIGLELALDQATRVRSLVPDSPAARSGILPGDDILALEGQPLISPADVSWVLHHAPPAGSLSVTVSRSGRQMQLPLELPEGWRSRSDISRRVGTWGMRAMALGGLLLEDLPDAERERVGLGKDRLGLVAKHVGEYGEHAAAKRAGFRKGDVIVEIDGWSTRHSEGELIGRLLERHRPGEKVKATVQRGSERLELLLPMQ